MMSQSKSKKIIFALSIISLLVSCAQEKETIRTVYIQSPDQVQDLDKTNEEELRALELLLSEKRPNMALAAYLSDSLDKSEKELTILFEKISSSEIHDLIQQIQRENTLIRERYLYHGKNYANNNTFISKTLTYGIKQSESSFSFKTQLSVGVSSYVRSKALDEIVASYNQQALKLAQELTGVFAKQIGEKEPAQAREIENMVAQGVDSEIIKKKITDTLEKIDSIASTLSEANLSTSEKHIVVSSGILATGIYQLVKDKKEFKRIIEDLRQLQAQFENIKAKYKEFIALTSALNEHAEQSVSNAMAFRDGIREGTRGLAKLYKETMASADGASGFEAKRVLDFIDQKIRGKKTNTPSPNNSTISEINTNFHNGIDALGKMASSLDAILLTTTKITDLLGIKLSSDVQKTIKTAQEVANVVNVGAKAFELFQTGGVSAALSVLGGGSPLGGNATDARLDVIDKKLDQVLDNQRMMLQAQVETMNMIKNLAIMIDEYHEKQMNAIFELRDLSWIQLEIEKANLVNKEIKSCEQLINYQLSSVWPGQDSRKSPYHNLGHIELLQARLSDRTIGLRGIRSLVNSSGEQEYHLCQQAFLKAFSGNVNIENPLMSIYDSGDKEGNLLAFSRRFYKPTLMALKEFSHDNNLDQSALHHPMTKIGNLDLKNALLPRKNEDEYSPLQNQLYALENLISVKNTERYVTSLLLLYPLYDLRKSDWELDLEGIVNTYLNNTASETPHAIRSAYYLSGALKVIQTAIAQQALLAGEPIIPGLYSRYHSKLLSQTDCSQSSDQSIDDFGEHFLCALRSNKQLMSNYLKYVLNFKNVTAPDKWESYKFAYETGNLNEISKYLNTSASLVLTKNKQGQNVPAVKLSAMSQSSKDNTFIEYPLPSIEELFDNYVSYNENMRQLLKMQDFIIYELEKVHPQERDFDVSTLLKLWQLK